MAMELRKRRNILLSDTQIERAKEAIRKKIIAPEYLTVYSDKTKGRGIKTKKELMRNEFITFYNGVHRENVEDKDDYYFEVRVGSKRFYIDASKEDGSFGRLFNDNNEAPNVYVKPVTVDGFTYPCYFAKVDIKPEEELEYDYGGRDKDYFWRKHSVSKGKRIKILEDEENQFKGKKIKPVQNEITMSQSFKSRAVHNPTQRTETSELPCNDPNSSRSNISHIEEPTYEEPIKSYKDLERKMDLKMMGLLAEFMKRNEAERIKRQEEEDKEKKERQDRIKRQEEEDIKEMKERQERIKRLEEEDRRERKEREERRRRQEEEDRKERIRREEEDRKERIRREEEFRKEREDRDARENIRLNAILNYINSKHMNRIKESQNLREIEFEGDAMRYNKKDINNCIENQVPSPADVATSAEPTISQDCLNSENPQEIGKTLKFLEGIEEINSSERYMEKESWTFELSEECDISSQLNDEVVSEESLTSEVIVFQPEKQIPSFKNDNTSAVLRTQETFISENPQEMRETSQSFEKTDKSYEETQEIPNNKKSSVPTLESDCLSRDERIESFPENQVPSPADVATSAEPTISQDCLNSEKPQEIGKTLKFLEGIEEINSSERYMEKESWTFELSEECDIFSQLNDKVVSEESLTSEVIVFQPEKQIPSFKNDNTSAVLRTQETFISENPQEMRETSQSFEKTDKSYEETQEIPNNKKSSVPTLESDCLSRDERIESFPERMGTRSITAANNCQEERIKKKNSFRPCPFCGIQQTKLSRHLRNKHKSEPEVVEALKLPTEQRIHSFALLRKKGIALANERSLKIDGKLKFSERISKNMLKYVKCSICSGFYKKYTIDKHLKVCKKSSPSTSVPDYIPVCGRSCEDSEFNHKVLSCFTDDEIGTFLKEDVLLQAYGKHLYEKAKNSKEKKIIRRKGLMIKLRRIGAIFIYFKRVLQTYHMNDVTSSLSLFDKGKFNDVMKAIKNMVDDGIKIKFPSKIQLGFQLKSYCKYLKRFFESNEDYDSLENVSYFLNQLQLDWNVHFSEAQNHVNNRDIDLLKPQKQPTDKEVTIVDDFIDKTLKNLDSKERSQWTVNDFLWARRAVICKVTFWNARRVSEVASLSSEKWEDALNDKWMSTELLEKKDKRSKSLLKSYKLAWVHGKGDSRVPIIFPNSCIPSIIALQDKEIRRRVGVNPDNKYCFPHTKNSESHAEGSSDIKYICSEAGLTRTINSTNMRHRLSTIFANKMPKNHLEAFYRHMGHSEEMSRKRYQAPPSTQELLLVGGDLHQINKRKKK
ncbi:UNVERIFIED_CONTAM: hypothetical protein RMT77_017654 [Armadillidium vulgare]